MITVRSRPSARGLRAGLSRPFSFNLVLKRACFRRGATGGSTERNGARGDNRRRRLVTRVDVTRARIIEKMKLIPVRFVALPGTLDLLDSFGKYRESIEDTLGKAYEKILGNVHAYAPLACSRASRSRCSTRDLSKVEINSPTCELKLTGEMVPLKSADRIRFPIRRCANRLTAITRAHSRPLRQRSLVRNRRRLVCESRRQGVTQFAQTSRELRGRELRAIACSGSRRREPHLQRFPPRQLHGDRGETRPHPFRVI